MKLGIAKFDAGYANVALKPADNENKDRFIVKGSRWYVPDNYDFKAKESIFDPELKKKVEAKDGK
jgi:hypothetical protein